MSKPDAKSIQDRIDEIFMQCCTISAAQTSGSGAAGGSSGGADFACVGAGFWPVLDNRLTIVDLAGIYTMAMPSHAVDSLDSGLFTEFFNAVARVKYPTGKEFVEKLLEDFKQSKTLHPSNSPHDTALFARCMDKAAVRVLLKFDLSLRRSFSTFAGKAITVGGGLTWEEVKRLGVGMEIDGFVAFAGSFSIIPAMLDLKQCETLAKEVLRNYPAICSKSTLHSALSFPQFQLLLCLASIERVKAKTKADKTVQSSKFAKKVIEPKDRPIADLLSELLRDLGVDKSTVYGTTTSGGIDVNTITLRPSIGDPKGRGMTKVGGTSSSSLLKEQPSQKDQPPAMVSPEDSFQQLHDSFDLLATSNSSDNFLGTVTMPSSERIEDRYTASMSHGRQAMLLRMDMVFDEVETSLLSQVGPGSELAKMLSGPQEEIMEMKSRLSSKPVVIGDSVPVPEVCPETVEQLLEAALAHHNLGSFQEALKFLEAARVQQLEICRRQQVLEEAAATSAASAAAAALRPVSPGSPVVSRSDTPTGLETDKSSAAPTPNPEALKSPAPLTATMTVKVVTVPFDLEMYITICKGNVYQSCGDDEQSLIQYKHGWHRAKESADPDWEIVCLNCIGILAYYNLRYDIALMCFAMVAKYRAGAYGQENADTATAWNNEACCLYCLKRRGEARVRFERCWNSLCNSLGHRAARTVVVWKNLEKARRSLRSGGGGGGSSTLQESVEMRPDAARLLIGRGYIIKAINPFEVGEKKKKRKKSGKKKK